MEHKKNMGLGNTLEGMEAPDEEHFHEALDLLESHHAGELTTADLAGLGDMDPRTLAALFALVSALRSDEGDEEGEEDEEERGYALSAVERWRSYAMGEPPRPGLVLAPSKTNPQVKRWQKAGGRPPVGERLKKLKEVVAKGGTAAIKGADALLGAVAGLYASRMLTDYMKQQIPKDVDVVKKVLGKK